MFDIRLENRIDARHKYQVPLAGQLQAALRRF